MTTNKPRVRLLALVGTDHHPFDRMIELVDEVIARFTATGVAIEALVQFGTAAPPTRAAGKQYLAKEAVLAEILAADIVLSHGGPSTIVEILRSGQLPLVMPRDPERGEHVDGHQQRFARHMANQELVQLLDSADELEAAISKVLRGETRSTDLVDSLPSPDESASRLGNIVAEIIAAKKARPRVGWWRTTK